MAAFVKKLVTFHWLSTLLLMGVFCLLTSTQLLSLGLLGEVSARLYYQRDGHRPFSIATTIGQPASSSGRSKPSRTIARSSIARMWTW